jgi:hypothetical protein
MNRLLEWLKVCCAFSEESAPWHFILLHRLLRFNPALRSAAKPELG